MERRDALGLLKGDSEGVQEWNRRREAGEEIPALFGADLRRVCLSEAILRRVDLRGTKLRGADLRGADLTEANLAKADLTGSNLSGAELAGTNLTECTCSGTTFGEVSLSSAIGLAEVRHHGPSIVGVDTLYMSEGRIPEVFLRGCGVPENMIRCLRSLVVPGKSVQEVHSWFISFSHRDRSFARRLHGALQDKGIRCWLDEKQPFLDEDNYERTDRGIHIWDKVLLCVSRESLEKNWWVDSEIHLAQQKERKLKLETGKDLLALMALDIDGFVLSDMCQHPPNEQLRSRLAGDFHGWESDDAKFESELEEVVKALIAKSGHTPDLQMATFIATV